MIFLDDRVTRHPKVLDAGVAARTLWLNAICWAAQYRTGGHVTTEQLAACIAHELGELRMPGPDGRLRKATVPGLIERLVRSGLLEVVAEGLFQIHDFAEYQRTQPAAPTVEAIEERKKARSEKLSIAGSKGAAKRWGTAARKVMAAARRVMAPDSQAMPEAIDGHSQAIERPSWPSGSPSSSEIRETKEKIQSPPSDGLMASLDGQAIDGHSHEAMPMAMREGGVDEDSPRKEPAAEKPSGVFRTAAALVSDPTGDGKPSRPSDEMRALSEAYSDAVRETLKDPAWRWEGTTLNLQGFRSVVRARLANAPLEDALRYLREHVARFVGQHRDNPSKACGFDPRGFETWAKGGGMPAWKPRPARPSVKKPPVGVWPEEPKPSPVDYEAALRSLGA